MEVSRVFEGSKEKMFSIFTNSILEDIKNFTDEDMTQFEIKEGYSYKKPLRSKIGKEGDIKVVIQKFDIPNIYEATFESAQGVNTLSYLLEEIDDTHFKLTYNENFVSEKKSNNLNFGLMSKLYKRSNKKQADLLLNQLEAMMLKE